MTYLLIAEKPKVARKIANALGNPDRTKKGKVSYYELETKQGRVIVASAVGHVYTLEQTTSGREYPEFDIEWVPSYETDDDNQYMKQYIQVVENLRDRADVYVNACDYDVEGSTIGANMLRFACKVDLDETKRMHFSTLTQDDLRDAFQDLEEFDKGQTYAGLTRHKLDWYFGINLSRALMSAVKTQGTFKVLSTGRVQGPTLNVLTEREREIEAFDPEPYWQLFFHGKGLQAQYEEEKIWEEDKAENIHADCEGEDGEVTDVEKNRYKHWPPNPFNLSDLQTAAYKHFNYKPKRTQQIAQELYEQSLISYPRTSSQKLDPKIGFKSILNKLKQQDKYADKAKIVLGKDNVWPNQGKKEDDAHPAIHPTGLQPGNKLSKQQRNVYDLVVKRFLATFGDPAIRQSMKITLDVNNYTYHAKGKKTLEPNWHNLYEPYVKLKEIKLPQVEEGTVIPQEELELVEKETQPPKRYSQSSLVNELEKRGLGTKATRSNIVDSLYNRNYIEDDPIHVTELGKAVVDALKENAPRILSEELTREFEENMEKIRQGDAAPDDILGKAETELSDVLNTFKEHESDVGEKLVAAISATRKQQNTLGTCPECGEDLVIRKSGDSRFVGCDGYPDCENTYPLPGYGKIETTDQVCDECNTPKVKVIRKGKKPWLLCLDTECPTKDDWNTDND